MENEVVNYMYEGNNEEVFDGEVYGNEQAKRNIMQKINEEKIKRATAKVVGVLKKMNKTYGGSVISMKDMTKQTKTKFEDFIKNLNIDRANAEKYRVFVPFNMQLPQAIIKSQIPEAFEKKRLILRYSKWNRFSPFPQGQFVKILGDEGRMDTESAMILHEYNVDTRPFS